MRIKAPESLLLIIDLQSRLLPSIHQGNVVIENAAWLLDVAQTIGVPVLATEQYPKGLGQTEPGLRSRLQENQILEKIHFSAVTESGLLNTPWSSRPQWVLAGTETHVCVQQTALDLLAKGYQVFIVEEAVGSRKPRDKELALQRMRQAGAQIVSCEMIAFEWLEKAGTPLFRTVLQRFIR